MMSCVWYCRVTLGNTSITSWSHFSLLVRPHRPTPKSPLRRGTPGVARVVVRMRRRVAHHGGVEGRHGRAGGQPLRRGRRVHAGREDVLRGRPRGRPRGGLTDAQVEPGVPGVVRRLGGVLVLPLAGVLQVEMSQS